MTPSLNIRGIWESSFDDFRAAGHCLSSEQKKVSRAILDCKTGRLGANIRYCPDCGHSEYHNNSCRNRNCPNCQAVRKELWVDRRRSEVIDAPYFHVVFTLPHELNPLFLCNTAPLYGLFHKCCARTLLELSENPKFLGAVPGIIQVLHTWDQEMNYHVHMHCIISGGGLTKDGRIRKSKKHFFIPVRVLRDKFKGKFLAELDGLYRKRELTFSASCAGLVNSYEWNSFRDLLYGKDWCPFIKETFDGFGNAIEYLGRYTHKIAISNSRLLSVSGTHVSFSARGRKNGDPRRVITLTNTEFIRRFLVHVLPHGFRKIRYYGFLNNRMKTENLRLIFRIQGGQRFKSLYSGMSTEELLLAAWKVDLKVCPVCGGNHMLPGGRTFAASG